MIKRKLRNILLLVAWSNSAMLALSYLPPANAELSVDDGKSQQAPSFGEIPDNDQVNQNIFDSRNDLIQDVNYRNQDTGINGNEFYQVNNPFEHSVHNFGSVIPALSIDYDLKQHPQPIRARNDEVSQKSAHNDQSYKYAYEIENSVKADETRLANNGGQIQGGYSYTGDDGRLYRVRYTADENGLSSREEHQRTSPPIPEEILKALERNSRGEINAIYDDGSNREAKHNNAGPGQSEAQSQSDFTQSAYNGSRSFLSNIGGFIDNNNLAQPVSGSAFQVGADTGLYIDDSSVVHSHDEPQLLVGYISGLSKTYLPPIPDESSVLRFRPRGAGRHKLQTKVVRNKPSKKFNIRESKKSYQPAKIRQHKPLKMRGFININKGLTAKAESRRFERKDMNKIIKLKDQVSKQQLPAGEQIDREKLLPHVMFTSNNNLFL